MLIIKNGN